MKLPLFACFFMLIACSEKSLFENWSNVLDDSRTLHLKNGSIGKNSKALATSKDCHYDIEIEGRKDAGYINVIADSKVKQHCHDKVPTKMMYNVMGDKLKVCSDYADGRHNCEMMKKNIN